MALRYALRERLATDCGDRQRARDGVYWARGVVSADTPFVLPPEACRSSFKGAPDDAL